MVSKFDWESHDKNVDLHWSEPEKNRGPVDNYKVVVKFDGKVVEENTTEHKVYTFVGDYYQRYTVEVCICSITSSTLSK